MEGEGLELDPVETLGQDLAASTFTDDADEAPDAGTTAGVTDGGIAFETFGTDVLTSLLSPSPDTVTP